MPAPFPTFISQRGRSHGLRLYLYLGLGALVLTIVAGGLGALLFIQDTLEQKSREEVRALARHAAHQGLLLSLLDQELGLRGYLATGDPAFLKAYTQGRREEGDALRTILANLNDLDRPALAKDLTRLEDLVRAWHDDVATPQIEARTRGPMRDLRAAMERGKAHFGTVRDQSDVVRRLSDERDNRRIQALELAVSRAQRFSAVGVALLLAGAFLVVRWIHQKVAQPMRELAEEAQAGNGFLEPLEVHPVQEVDILSRALAQLDLQVRERERSLRDEREEVLAVQAFTGLVQEIRAEEELIRTLIQAMERLLKPHRLVLLLRPEHGEGLVPYLPEMLPGDPEAHEILSQAHRCRAIRRMTPLGLDSGDPTACLCSVGLPPGGSYLCLPLVTAGQVLGLVNLQAREPEFWTLDRRRVAEACVSVAAAALQAIRALKLAEERSIRDGLTGIYNRRFLDEMVPKLLEQAHRTGHHTSVIMVDLDHFKRINDRFGHDTGDRVLVTLARCLSRQIRSGDLLARYGGEEFALLLPSTNFPVAMGLAERFRSAVENLPLPSTEFPPGLKLTASMGVATYPDHGTVGEAVFSAADKALYLAKGSGRNLVKGADELL